LRKKIILKSTVVISLIMCLLLIFNTAALAVESSPDALGVDKISISPRCGIVEGKTAQMKVTLSPESAKESSVEWYSSNPSVISCTEDGLIKGLSAGNYADITCKAKIGSKKETVRIYCVESIGDYKESEFTDFLTLIYKQPFAGSLSSVHVSRKFLYSLLAEFLRVILPYFGRLILNTNTLNRVLLTGGECQVMGRYGSFAYIAVANQSNATDGFVKYTHLDKVINEFLNLSATDMNIWANGVTYENRKLTTTYKGEVEWDGWDKNYIDFDESTGQIVGKVPGQKTIITARSDGMTAKCTIHLLYKWPQPWTAKTNKQTHVYQAEGSKYKEVESLSKGKTFVVQGDCGTDNGWAYGYYPISDNDKIWGYIPIADVSTKGTVSQYNLMNFRWPINDINIKKISSPFGPRSSNNGGNHKGFDIVSDVSGEVEGKPVVASYNGTITRIYVDNNKETSHGNAIVIATDKIDPISGKNLTVIYMHLSRWDTNSSGNIVVNGKALKEGGSVTKEQIIGCAGNTGYNTSGAHLHYEVNNQNAAIRSGSNNPFTETINPIYFYMDMDKSISKSDTCEAASNGNGFYWYGENE